MVEHERMFYMNNIFSLEFRHICVKYKMDDDI